MLISIVQQIEVLLLQSGELELGDLAFNFGEWLVKYLFLAAVLQFLNKFGLEFVFVVFQLLQLG